MHTHQSLPFRLSRTDSLRPFQARISRANGRSSFFYPADFTFVCPTELEDLADKYEQLKGLGVEVFSVSTDTHFVHKAWHDASDTIKKIKYTMLADPTGVLSRGFGVYKEDEGVAYRGTFLVNPEGLVKIAEIQDNSIGRMLMSWYVRLRLRCSLLLTR